MLLHALALLAPLAAIPAEDGVPVLNVTPGKTGRIVLVRSVGNLITDGPRFLQAMTASGVKGHPVCMLVGDELTLPQIDLLNRLAVAEIVSVGEPPDDIGPYVTRVVTAASELFESAQEAVVTSLHIGDVYEAAPEAYRRGIPLVLGGDGLLDEVERLGVTKAWIVAKRHGVSLPKSIEAIDLSDPSLRWKSVCAENDEPYLALASANVRRAFTTGTPLGGALLAANHGGMLVAALEEPVEFHYAKLERSVRPEGLQGSKIRNWLVGEFEIDEVPRRIAVPEVGGGFGISGLVPRYGDPIVDTNDDGVFDEETETVVIGETCRFGAREVSISLRVIGAIGVTKFVDGMRTNRAVAVSPPAERVAARLAEVYGSSPLPAALLVVGDHREVPFDYVKDPVYAASIMHEQELASDNIYADPDGDGYLDVDVGRLVSSNPIQATTLASRLASYPVWERPETQAACLIYPAWAEDEAKLGAPTIFANFEAFMRGLDLDLGSAGFERYLHVREKGALELVYPHLGESSVILFAHHSGPDGWMFRIDVQDGKVHIDGLSSPASVASGGGGKAIPFLHAAPLVVGAGCDSAGLDFEVLFKNSIVHGFFDQGAIAYIGNTRAGFPDTEEFLLRHMLQGVLGLLPSQGEPQSLGEAFRAGKNFLDFLIRERGPFEGPFPFNDYSLPMRREWISLVLYGDPALRVHLSKSKRVASPVEVSAWSEGEARIRLRFDGRLVHAPVLITREVGKGPIEEVTALVAPGLSYGSVPWATFKDIEKPGPVGPGVFLDLPLPDGVGDAHEVTVESGPAWSLGGWRVLADARGRRRLQISIDFVRYAMAAPDERELAQEIVLAVK